MADLDRTLRALRARARREILALIWDMELPAGEIASAFSLTSATISGHLAVLRDAGLVTMTKVGTSRRYRARPEALAGLHGVLEGSGKWSPATALPEQELASSSTKIAVIICVDVPTPVETTFVAFTDADVYSRWLQVPVSLQDGRFAATMEWGTEVRGRYEVVAAPHLIAMSWDFDDDNVPVPGHPLIGYLRIRPTNTGSRVEVHQMVDDPAQASFMKVAWGMVLGRLKANITSTLTNAPATPRRAPRPKIP